MSDPVERKPQPNSAFETSRSSRRKPSQLRHPAIKHGGYSGMSLLPGEDPAEFKKLHEELVTEYAPTGPHEHEIVETMTRLMWRKRCLWNYGLAEFARQRYSAIKFDPERIEFEPERPQMNRTAKSTDELPEEERQQQAVSGDDLIELFVKLRRSPQYQRLIEQEKLKEEHIRRELGAVDLELAKIRHVATTGYLMHELSIIDRIDGMIDRCLKRLLLVRGLKSISSSAPNRLTASASAASEEKC
jgi:hypothetical protein